VFESNRSGSREIWTCKIDGSDQNQLTTFNGPYTGNPRWSPDGRQIAFDSSPEGHPHIYLISAEGGQPRQVTGGESNEVVPTWSRDGEWIYFASNRGGQWQVWKISAAGGNPSQVTRDGGYELVEANDSKSLYYNKYGLGSVGLFQSSLNAGSERQILGLPQLMSLGDWLSTREGIYFIERYRESGKPANPVTIKFLDFETGQKKVIATLPHDPTSNPGLNLTPDGRWLIYSIDDYRTFDIMLVDNFH
jgi:Tol biopolymer transport system component